VVAPARAAGCRARARGAVGEALNRRKPFHETAAGKPHYPKEETMQHTRRTFTRTLAAAAVVGAFGATFAYAQGQPVKIGLLATLEGPFAAGGADGMRGAEMAVREKGGMAGGRRIEIIKASSDAKPDVAVNATRKLVEQDKVDIMVGPLSGSEGIAVKDYSKTQPNITFINGSSGAQATTLVNPSTNFFRFNTEGAQWMVGLGRAALDKGYKRVMVIAEDYAFPYSQVQGFMTEYCRLGGKVPVKAWVPLGGKDYASVIARIPKDVDALVVVLGGADAVNFLNQYEQAGGDKPLIGGSITVSQDILNYKGKRRDSLVGTIAGAPVADAFDGADWKKFVADYQKAYPVSAGGYPSPSLFAFVYYVNMKAALEGLDAVKGDLSDGQKKYREALSKMVLKTPTGEVRLDGNRQAIGTSFVTEVAKDSKGNLYNKVLRKVDNVDQMLGMKKEEFKIGSRDEPSCP
jgi:branched-chain amino acid transport system substrate-binding protein